MIEPNGSAGRQQHNTTEPDAEESHAVAAREKKKPRDGGTFVRTRTILATTALLLVAGCQQKPDANIAGDHNKPATDKDGSSQVEKTSKTDDSMPTGKRVFASCATCHQSDGQGIVGKFPPLDGNPVVNGRADNVARIVLRGLHGPVEVNGKTFDGRMPSWSRFDDHSLAAVLTYIRESWSNDSPPVSEEFVAAVRKATNERKEAWTMTELESAPLIEVKPTEGSRENSP